MTFQLMRASIANAGSLLQQQCHGAAFAAGWWNSGPNKEPETCNMGAGDRPERRIVQEKLCLIHSEVSEAMEGHRKGLYDDKLMHRLMLEVELADAVIRCFDLAGGMGLDLGAAIAEKMVFNAQRPDHKLEVRAQQGGKGF